MPVLVWFIHCQQLFILLGKIKRFEINADKQLKMINKVKYISLILPSPKQTFSLNRIAIFASGSGTNAENLINYFNKKSTLAQVVVVVTNNQNAGVINKCKRHAVPVFVISNLHFEHTDALRIFLQKNDIHWIVLAGFLRKINLDLIANFPNRIINIHPALLPKFGGKGMHGNHVHEAIIAAKEKESGITIHYVNQNYDEGAIIFQASCAIEKDETSISLASKIHQLEQLHFPQILEQLLQKEKLNHTFA
jgi:phosphoribosylglycinamide formyltransferase-1